MTYEGITKFLYLTNYNNKSIEYFPTTREEKMTTITDNTVAGITAETALPGAKIYWIDIFWFIVAVQADKYYTFIGQTMNATNMHHKNVP